MSTKTSTNNVSKDPLTNSVDLVSKTMFQEMGSAAASDDLKILLKSHLIQTCGNKLTDLDPDQNKFSRFLVAWLARKQMEFVIRQFPSELSAELNKL